MSQVIQLARSIGPASACMPADTGGPLIRTDAVHVVFTTVDATIAAVRVAAGLAKAMSVPLQVIHFRQVPQAVSVEAPVGLSPIETERFMERLHAEDIHIRARVFLCRDERRAIPMAFKRRSIVVIGGRHRRWPTRTDRIRRRLETAGHFVVFVDSRERQEASRA